MNYETEEQESSLWLALELEQLREVRTAAKRLVESPGDEDRLEDLREALGEADQVAWYASRPSLADVAGLLAWHRRWPRPRDRTMRSWVEGNLGIVTDGHALLAVRDAQIAEYCRPANSAGVGPGTRVIQTVDWSRLRAKIVRQSNLRNVLALALGERADRVSLGDCPCVGVGPARLDPELMNRFLPPLWSDAYLEVYVGDDPCDPVGFRLYGAGSGAWTVVIMPQRADEAPPAFVVPLEVPPF